VDAIYRSYVRIEAAELVVSPVTAPKNAVDYPFLWEPDPGNGPPETTCCQVVARGEKSDGITSASCGMGCPSETCPGIDEANVTLTSASRSAVGVPLGLPFISAITVVDAVWLDDAFLSAAYAASLAVHG